MASNAIAAIRLDFMIRASPAVRLMVVQIMARRLPGIQHRGTGLWLSPEVFIGQGVSHEVVVDGLRVDEHVAAGRNHDVLPAVVLSRSSDWHGQRWAAGGPDLVAGLGVEGPQPFIASRADEAMPPAVTIGPPVTGAPHFSGGMGTGASLSMVPERHAPADFTRSEVDADERGPRAAGTRHHGRAEQDALLDGPRRAFDDAGWSHRCTACRIEVLRWRHGLARHAVSGTGRSARGW